MNDRTMGRRPASIKYGLRFALVSMALGCATPAGAIVRSWDDAGGSADKNWSNFGNWSPDGAVATADDIFIGNLAGAVNDTTIYDITTQIQSLTLSNGADVDTNGNELIVNGLTMIGGAGTALIVNQHNSGIAFDSFDTNELIINSGGSVLLTDAQLEIDGDGAGGDDLEINAGAVFSGYGEVDLEQDVGVGVQIFENSGTLTANNGGGFIGGAAGTLTLNVTDPDGFVDLDGDNEIGVVNINRADTLSIIGGNLNTDDFSGTMNLFDGSEFTTDNIWRLGFGEINVNTPGIFAGFAGAAAEISGSQFTMNAGGTITLDTADIDRLQFNADFTATGGTIANSNEIFFNNTTTIAAAVDFQMNGSAASITLLDGASVTINDADFDLDGSQLAGNITTIGSGALLDINLNDALADDGYGHTININGGELDVTNTATAAPWTLNVGGVVNAGGAATSILDGDELTIFGNINVLADSTLAVNTDEVTFDTSGDVGIAAGGEFNINTISRWVSSSSTVTGEGIFSPGSATIGVDALDAADVVWSADTVNVDDGSHTINLNSSLTITTDSIDNANDGIDSTITVEDTGTLEIGLNDGSDVVFENGGITYNGNIVSSTFLLAPASGSALRFTGISTLEINGDGGSLARIKLDGGTLNINDALEDFRLDGGTLVAGNTNEIDGGTVNGPGEFQAGTGHALRGNGTINAPVNFLGSAQLIADGGLLNVNGVLQDVGTLGTSGGTAVLNMALAWNTNVTATVLLQGGRIQGATITNDGAAGINGNGLVISRVINNTRIGAEGGGTLIIDNVLTDWDGAANTGSLNALGADLELRDNITFLFRGTVQANTGREVFANGFELEFEPVSSLNLSGGIFRSNRSTDIGGTVSVPGSVATLRISGTATFESTSNTTLGGDLVLDNTVTRVQSGATFSGGGTLENPSGSTLTLLDGADVDVLVENSGTLALGASPGQTTGLDFQQTATGTWEVELAGTGINDFDRMTLTGIASLAGVLDVSLIGGFVPTLGDSFTILLAGSVIGTFDSVLGSPGAGLVYDVAYNPGNVTLSVVNALVGDLDSDGFVGINDLNIVLANWNLNVPPANPLADPSGDGFVGIDDLNTVLGNWNAGTPPTAGSANIPEPGTLALIGAGLACVGRRRAGR